MKLDKNSSEGLEALDGLARYYYIHTRDDSSLRDTKEFKIVNKQLYAMYILKKCHCHWEYIDFLYSSGWINKKEKEILKKELLA